jgi:hypothetical protein
MQNINNLFLSIKGNNYLVNINNWAILNFSNINSKLANIESNFEKFISSEENNEENNINLCIKNIIKSNFNSIIKKLLSSFGNEYYERSVKYNEYFRINDLFDNLKYSLFQTSSFYLNEFDNNETNTFPKELKNIYKFNNIELLIQKKNKDLLELLNTKIIEFIHGTKEQLINKYISFMKTDADISLSFSQTIRQMINNNYDLLLNDIENDYTSTLNAYLNDSFIEPYSIIIDEETNEMIDYVNEIRNQLMEQTDDYFTLESEIVLEEINLQINNILDLINEYNSMQNDFKIPDELVTFLNNFGANNIKPIYDQFKNKVDKILNNNRKLHFETNSRNYENSINLNEFLQNANETFLSIKDNYINNITSNLNNYYDNYPKEFLKEINQENNIVYNNLDESFQKVTKKINNAELLIESLKEFNDYNKTIIKNINNLNLAYKESKKIIEDSDDDEETINNYNNKLEDLKVMSMDYYNKVNESYYNIRQYLNESFTNIYDKINNCINKTYETLINEYKKLSEEEESINKEYSKKENSQEKKHSFEMEDKQYIIEAKITEMESYAQFTLDLLFENNNYRYPKLVANITNKSRPKKMNVKIEPRYDDCGKGTTIEAIFDDANYKMNLNFDTKSENINVNTITNYEKYEYNIEIYKMKEEEEKICFVVAYIKFCLDNTKCKDKTILSNQKLYFDKKELIEKDFIEY